MSLGVIVSLIGGFGAAMAFVGALLATFAGGVGVTAGIDAAGGTIERGLLGVLASLVGVAGAVVVRFRLRTGGALLILSAVAGLAAALLFYAVGAVLLITGGALAFWSRRADGTSR